MVAHYLERPHERPAVGMKLGGGDVELGKKLPFKASEGKPKFHLLEQGGVDEAERPTVVPLVIGANWQVGGKVAPSSFRRAPCGMIGEAHPPSSTAELPQQSLQ